jgi:hypothetical protein
MPDMSMDLARSDRKIPPSRRLSTKLKAALDAMVWEGLLYADAARKVNLSTFAMRCALDKQHVQAYLRQQRQVFRASLVDEAIHRVRAISQQDENKAAAFNAASRLMSESDQEHSLSTQRQAPGLVVQIINSHMLPSNPSVEPVTTQVIDVAAEPIDTPRDE